MRLRRVTSVIGGGTRIAGEPWRRSDHDPYRKKIY
jgi:hypothetical protein